MNVAEPRPDDSPGVRVLCRMYALLAPLASDPLLEEIVQVAWSGLLWQAAKALDHPYESPALTDAEIWLSAQVGTAITGEDVHTSISEGLTELRAAIKAGRKKGGKK
jgi:hypothetical protein